MENTTEVLPCGCEREFVNGKWIWYTCDEHETGDNFEYKANYTKYKRSFDYEQ